VYTSNLLRCFCLRVFFVLFFGLLSKYVLVNIAHTDYGLL